MTNRTLLIDGDWLCYKAATVVETEIEWSEDQWTLTADVNEAFRVAEKWMEEWTEVVGSDAHDKPWVLFSDSSGKYFRNEVFPEYKGKRKGKRKPVCYKALRRRLEKEYDAFAKPRLEADDLMGIYATNYEVDNPVIVTIDKDLDTVPGLHYNPDKDKLYEVSPEEAKWNHMFQTLVGDATDGFKGCPGVGAVKAKKILEAALESLEAHRDCSWDKPPYENWTEEDIDEYLWASVEDAFEAAGLSKSEANVQAQLAHILQDGDYDFETGEVRLKEWM